MRRTVLTLALLMTAAGCGDDSGGIATPTTAAPPTSASTTTTAPAPAGGVVSGLDLVTGLRANVNATSTTTPADPTQPTSGTTSETTAGTTTGDSYTAYTDLIDDSGQIQVSVPIEWTDIDTSGWSRGGEHVGPAALAAPDLPAWRAEWGTPGLFIGASDSLGETTETILDGERWDTSCTYQGRDAYDDGLYVGHYDLYADCGDELSVFIVIAAEPPDGSFLIYVQIVIVADRDWDAADEIIRTFQVSSADV
jgi:hypothetical protein